MNDNGGGWPVWQTLLFGGLGIVVAFAVISGIAPWVFDCGEASAKECSEIVRNNGLAVAGVFAGLIGLLALHFNARRTHTDRLRLTNDTYVKAIEQLRSESVEVRIGGMYALERIAHEEQRYHWPVIETLSAYIRERAPWPPKSPEKATGLDAVAAAIVLVGDAVSGSLERAQKNEPKSSHQFDLNFLDSGKEQEQRATKLVATDIQTALIIIGHRSEYRSGAKRRRFRNFAPHAINLLGKILRGPLGRNKMLGSIVGYYLVFFINLREGLHSKEARRINLSHADLRGADLTKGFLANAYFVGSNLSSACFIDAILDNADFRFSILYKTSFGRAEMHKINLNKSNVTQADFGGANMSGAFLCDTTAVDANFYNSQLKNAVFISSILKKADMRAIFQNTHLSGSDLEQAKFVDQPSQIGAIVENAKNLDKIIIDPD